MESNGKRVNLAGKPLDYECTVVNFGEPGTNGKFHTHFNLFQRIINLIFKTNFNNTFSIYNL